MIKTRAAGSLKPGDRVETYHYGPGTVLETAAHQDNGGHALVDVTIKPDETHCPHCTHTSRAWAITIRNEPASARWTLDESETAA